jgi:putative nucleotidyltransferase with HDIG domain
VATQSLLRARPRIPQPPDASSLSWLDDRAGAGAARGTVRPPASRGSASYVAAGLEAALRARAPGAQTTTPLVRLLAGRVAKELGLDTSSRALLDVAVRTRDIGMIALPDPVLLTITPLSPVQWQLMNRHPVVGAELLAGLPVVAPAAAIVRAHHERWDGGGYPDGTRGDAIPLLSRIIAICDAFAATATDRPHRRGLGPDGALALICQESGAQFDATVVDALVSVLARGRRPHHVRKPAHGANGDAPEPDDSGDGLLDLPAAVAALDVVPALAPAAEHVLALAASDAPSNQLVESVESDTGLTVAVLRRAQPRRGRRPIANVTDAVMALGPTGVAEAVATVPFVAFPWRTSQIEAMMHRCLVHAQAVARATDRIAQELGLKERDDLLVAALLHDVGKLVLSRTQQYAGATERRVSPEARARDERQTWGMDHASLSGLLIRRWGLPEQLASTVAAHHTAEDASEIATHVRLADMAAHHAQGDTVDRSKLLSLAHTCGVTARALREILFDLPHAGGSHQRRAEPSPLSPRETDALRGLADGLAYKDIADLQEVKASTVRTHLHHVYQKLGVIDRAQAVLRATEMGWL